MVTVLDCKKFGTHSILDFDNRISLRFLIPCSTYYGKNVGIGMLTSLRRLLFPVHSYKLSELKDLIELCELKIDGLENHKHREEVNMVQLHSKKNLSRFELVWSDEIDVAEEYELVLDCLKPPDSLKELTIERYHGARSPSWMEPEELKNLEYMSTKECLAWKNLPSLEKLPYLKKLILTRMRELEQIDFEGGFPHLKLLSFSDCEQWKDWSGLKAEMVPWCPLLQKLIIKDCPKLNALPPLPLSVSKNWSCLMWDWSILQHFGWVTTAVIAFHRHPVSDIWKLKDVKS
ncbi:uncharacterized protein A4U43_C03F10070 [Asparagus officinalis]|uniref:R13L1/DRL21-like LRR repeat region domain-containing protein n=1 Tax=Asparagus officinalis TaxID=4686 RepID=A0A5P1FE00_ASPOF|nr:uncharacterized protein A4U43_C03F10070 [Asparagus officinalis]